MFRLHARERFLTGDLARRREIARALGVRYVLDEGRVFIELHPLLVPMQPGGEGEAQPIDGPEDGPDAGRIEPPESGSGSTKRADFSRSVPAGWADGKEIEPRQGGAWDRAFRLVWEENLFFPA